MPDLPLGFAHVWSALYFIEYVPANLPTLWLSKVQNSASCNYFPAVFLQSTATPAPRKPQKPLSALF